MKKIFTTFAMLLVVVILAQSPEKMSYQTVIRNASNTLVINQTVGVKISLLQGSATGSSVYAETHTITTNANGLASLQIGGGTVVSGTFSSIDWANGPYFIKTETDPSGGTNYTLTGTSQLLSVPYALYAKAAGSSTPGPQGPSGKNSLINISNELAGSNCVNGGLKFEVGLDLNTNEILDSNEVNNQQTKYLCQITQNSSRIFSINSTGNYQVPTGKTWKITNIIVSSSPPTYTWNASFVRYDSSGCVFSGYSNWLIADFNGLKILKSKSEIWQYGQSNCTNGRSFTDTFQQSEISLNLPIILNSGNNIYIDSGLVINIEEI